MISMPSSSRSIFIYVFLAVVVTTKAFHHATTLTSTARRMASISTSNEKKSSKAAKMIHRQNNFHLSMVSGNDDIFDSSEGGLGKDFFESDDDDEEEDTNADDIDPSSSTPPLDEEAPSPTTFLEQDELGQKFEFEPFIPKLNIVTLSGRVGNVPDPRYFDDGKVVLNLGLAVKRKYHPLERRVKNVQYGQEETDWFTLELWGRDAEFASRFVDKGSRIGVTGSLVIDSWFDKETSEYRRKPKILVKHLDVLETKAEAELRRRNREKYRGGGGSYGGGGGGGNYYNRDDKENDYDDDSGPSSAGTGGFFS